MHQFYKERIYQFPLWVAKHPLDYLLDREVDAVEYIRTASLLPGEAHRAGAAVQYLRAVQDEISRRIQASVKPWLPAPRKYYD